MKAMITTIALTLSTGLATAGDFAYERQWASEDLAAETSSLVYRSTDPAPSERNFRVSLHQFTRGNPDIEVLPESYRETNTGSNRSYCTTGYDRLAMDNPDLSTIC